MRKNQRKFSDFEPVEPSAGLFDRIIAVIKKEQELRHSKRLLFGFALLLLLSFIATPLSWSMFVNQIKTSGILYFISAAITDFGTFLSYWKDFALAILESLPITGIVAFALSIGLALFTLRLFLYPVRNISLIRVLFRKEQKNEL